MSHKVHGEFHPAKESDAARLKELRVPPAWRNVKLNADTKSDLQAVGIDTKGQAQYRYSAKHTARAAAEKFGRLKDFNKALPKIRSQVEQDVHKSDEAAVLYTIDKTAFRIGSDRETGGEVKAIGVSTLTSEHVKVQGEDVSFKFLGKHGVLNEKTVRDKKLAAIMTPRIAAKGRLFNTSDAKVRGYMSEISGESFSPKDYRTWHGTTEALKQIKSMPVPKTEKEYKESEKAVLQHVSKHLGNTPAVAKSSYIDPGVWSPWRVKSK